VISGAARVAPEKAVFRPALPMSFQPGISEMRMEKLSWSHQYKHPNWQKKRLEVMEAAGFSCENCGDKDTTLNVHHRRYVKGRKVWEYTRDELQCLCEDCHAQEHADRELLQRVLDAAEADGYGAAAVIGLIAGYIDGGCGLDEDLTKAALDADGYHYDLGMLASIAAGAEWPLMSEAARVISRSGKWTPPQQNAIFRWEEQLDPTQHLQWHQLREELKLLEPESVPAIQGLLVGFRNGIVAGPGVPPSYVDAVLIDDPDAGHGYAVGMLAKVLLNDASLEEVNKILDALRAGDAGQIAEVLSPAVEQWRADRLARSKERPIDDSDLI
jgi:hypothetical protein